MVVSETSPKHSGLVLISNLCCYSLLLCTDNIKNNFGHRFEQFENRNFDLVEDLVAPVDDFHLAPLKQCSVLLQINFLVIAGGKNPLPL